ncbi:MAG: hypothetical protein ACK5ZG_00870 [Phycisphaerae bacterium]|jgi:hypothetical protein
MDAAPAQFRLVTNARQRPSSSSATRHDWLSDPESTCFPLQNCYVIRARLSEADLRQFPRHVAPNVAVVQISQLTGLNRYTVNRLLDLLRERMAQAYET